MKGLLPVIRADRNQCPYRVSQHTPHFAVSCRMTPSNMQSFKAHLLFHDLVQEEVQGFRSRMFLQSQFDPFEQSTSVLLGPLTSLGVKEVHTRTIGMQPVLDEIAPQDGLKRW